MITLNLYKPSFITLFFELSEYKFFIARLYTFVITRTIPLPLSGFKVTMSCRSCFDTFVSLLSWTDYIYQRCQNKSRWKPVMKFLYFPFSSNFQVNNYVLFDPRKFSAMTIISNSHGRVAIPCCPYLRISTSASEMILPVKLVIKLFELLRKPSFIFFSKIKASRFLLCPFFILFIWFLFYFIFLFRDGWSNI